MVRCANHFGSCDTCTDDIRKYWEDKEKEKLMERANKVSIHDDFQGKALLIVSNYIKNRLEKTDPHVEFSVYIVWFSKTLQNWKALVSSTLPDGRYYEVTYDGEKLQTYLDAYVKVDNVCVKDEELNKETVRQNVFIHGGRGVQVGHGMQQTNHF